MNKKQVEYGLAGLGSALLAYYILSKSRSNIPTQTSTPSNTSTASNTTPSTAPISTQSTSTQSAVNAQCEEITPNNFSQQLLVQCFGGSLTSCGLYEPLTTKTGFCEAFSPSTNYSVNKPNIKSGFMFYNSTDAFFGIYWDYPGTFGGVSPCYCNGSNQVFPATANGAFFDYIGLIMPHGYTWLPTYYFPSAGVGFLTYQGALWYSPNLIYANLDYIKQNNILYTVTINNTPDKMGYSVNSFTTPADTGGALCFNYAGLNSSFCISVAPNQTIPFWQNSTTVVRWCPANNAPNCQTVA
jgi:hypothetical protein